MSLWKRLAEMVALDGAAALVSVHAVRGSAPRAAGARMIVRPDGAFHGSIGGGRLEWEALAAARQALAAGRGPARFLHQALGPDLGQCCGGHVTLLIETFDRSDADELLALAQAERAGAFEVEARLNDDGRVMRDAIPSPLAGEGREGGRQSQSADPEGEASRFYDAPSSDPLALHARRPPSPTLPRKGGEGASHWLERHGESRTPLLLFGAGHVGRALVLALAPLPFAIRWIDSRREAFPAHVPANATPVHSPDPPAEIRAAQTNSLVLVMTHDHALDLAITAKALGREDLPFVGLIGSATKRARFEKRLRELGIPEARIRALVCPIGVPGITGKEPAVIGASVAAQLLQARSRLARSALHLDQVREAS